MSRPDSIVSSTKCWSRSRTFQHLLESLQWGGCGPEHDMRALINQSNHILSLQEANKVLTENVKVLEDDLGDTKLKLFHLEYEFKDLTKKDTFSTTDSIVIRNLALPQHGDDEELHGIKEVLGQLQIEDFDPEQDIVKME